MSDFDLYAAGRALRVIREEVEVSREAFAAAFGVTPGVLDVYEDVVRDGERVLSRDGVREYVRTLAALI